MNDQSVFWKIVPCSSMPYKHGRREYEEGATTFRLPSNLLWMKQLLVIYQKLAGTIIFMPCVGEKKNSCHAIRAHYS